VGQLEPDVTGTRTFANDDVQGIIFHSWVKNFFNCAAQAMNLINEEKITFAQVGQNGSQITRTLDGRTRSDFQINFHLVGNDTGQGRFAQTGRPIE
jgi:hypothetical protein